MLLRSGRILSPKTESETKMVKLEETNPKAETEIIKELKIFFRSLFYHCCKDIGNKERIDDIERIKGRKATLDELINWGADESFWKTSFQKSWFRMLNELPSSKLLQAVDHFMKYEYNLQPQNPECVTLKSQLRSYLLELYIVNDSSKMLRLMDEQNQVKNSTSKEIYLRELASDLSSQVVNHPLFNNQSNVISWDKFFQNSRSRCCYIPEVEGGQTVLKLPFSICNFSIFFNPQMPVQDP